MATLKSFTIAAALLVTGTSLAVAQNGPATGGQPPAATSAPPGPGVIPHDVTPGATAGTTRVAPTTRHHRACTCRHQAAVTDR